MDTAPARPKSQHADGGASGAPAAARCPAQRAPGWLPDVPTLAEGSWAQRSIARWGLTPPYDRCVGQHARSADVWACALALACGCHHMRHHLQSQRQHVFSLAAHMRCELSPCEHL